jgi:glycosyltransferase involved in cell wall biosynthesis
VDSARQISIGLVGPLPPPSGGMANQTRQLARLLADAAISVEIVQVNARYRPHWIGSVRGVRAVFRLVPYLRHLWRCAGRADLFHVMANSGWAWHLCAAPAVWIARLRGVPVVVNYRGGEAEQFLRRQVAWVRPTLRRAFAIVVPSGFLQDVFGQFEIAAEIVPNIVDLSRFHPGPPRAASHNIIVTRNLEDIYDIPTALRAFAVIRSAYPDATLTVAGSGPRLDALQQLAQTLGVADGVRFTGRIDNEHITELYRNADLMLNPSTADNMPISLLEAMASAVPIVTTNVGGIPHLVTDARNALLVAPGDPSAMAAAAIRVFAEEGLARRLVEAGAESAAGYTWAQVRPRLFGVYARALGVASLHHFAT